MDNQLHQMSSEYVCTPVQPHTPESTQKHVTGKHGVLSGYRVRFVFTVGGDQNRAVKGGNTGTLVWWPERMTSKSLLMLLFVFRMCNCHNSNGI